MNFQVYLAQAATMPRANPPAATTPGSAQPGSAQSDAPRTSQGFIPLPNATSGSSLLRDSAPDYHYNRPFLQPAPVWDYWFALLFPLLLFVCIVYKGIKVSHIRELPKQAAIMFGWLLLSLAAAAVALQLFVRWTS